VRSPAALLRAALVALVLVLVFGPYWLRSAVPIWAPFLILAGLEIQFLLGAFRPQRPRTPSRGPQPIDQELYGYAEPEPELWADGEPNAIEPDEGEAPRRRPWLRLAAGATVLAALFAAAWLVDTRSGWDGLDDGAKTEAMELFSEEATGIARKPVTVECDESRDRVGTVQHSDGAAFVGGGRAWLTPEICLDLYRLAFRGEVNGSRTARAVAVLAHEAWHLRGVSDEGETECYALQTGVTLGERLGLSESQASRAMRGQLAENALRRGRGLEYVVPPECRDGGRLDLDPDSSRFP
jgi:hypothetical protein